MINTRLWNDTWVSNLDPIEKLLFVYCLTNEHTNISGIYELPLKVAAIETGIDQTMFDKIIPRLKPKIFFFKGWVIIPNFPKYQSSDNPKVQVGVKNALTAVPSHIKEKAIAYGYPMGSLGMYLDSDLNSNSNTTYEVVKVSEKEPREKKDTSYYKVFRLFSDPWPTDWTNNTTQISCAKNLIKEQKWEDIVAAMEYVKKNSTRDFFPQIIKPSDLDRKWLNLEAYYKKHG